MTVTTGAALAPDDEPDGAGEEANGILVDAGTPGETGSSFVFVPHVIGGISLTVAPDVVVEGVPSDGPDGDGIDSLGSPPAPGSGTTETLARGRSTADESVRGSDAAHQDLVADANRLLPSPSAVEGLAPSPPVSRADRVRAAMPFTGPGLTGLGGVVLGCLVVGLGAAGDLALGGGLGVGFTATFLLGCALVAATLRTRSLAVAVVLPPLLFAGGYALETKTSGQTSGRREMALDVATSLALHAPALFVGTVLALVVVLVRVIVHLIRR